MKITTATTKGIYGLLSTIGGFSNFSDETSPHFAG